MLARRQLMSHRACTAVEVRTWEMQAVGKESAAFHPSPRGGFADHLHRVLRTESRNTYWDNVDTRSVQTRPSRESYGKATDLIITNFHTGTDFDAHLCLTACVASNKVSEPLRGS